MAHTTSANYVLIGDNEKETVQINWGKTEEVKLIILGILEQDALFWKAANVRSQGVEKNNILKKVCEKIPINSAVIYRALDDLESEQKIIPYQTDNFVRYLLFTFEK